jgi:hypothetical protein
MILQIDNKLSGREAYGKPPTKKLGDNCLSSWLSLRQRSTHFTKQISQHNPFEHTGSVLSLQQATTNCDLLRFV